MQPRKDISDEKTEELTDRNGKELKKRKLVVLCIISQLFDRKSVNENPHCKKSQYICKGNRENV